MSEIKRTNKYEIFKFKKDNRDINQSHVGRLVASIKARNMLELRPIMVNSRYEVIDGQHRLLAARQLGVEVFYQINKDAEDNDFIILNSGNLYLKATDYLKYYCEQGNKEYIKLRDFMSENGLTLNIAMAALGLSKSKLSHSDFKHGQFVFPPFVDGNEAIDKAKDIISLLQSAKGKLNYLNSGAFFRALLLVCNSSDYNHEVMLKKIERQTDKVLPRVGIQAYLMMWEEIFNWNNKTGRTAKFSEESE